MSRGLPLKVAALVCVMLLVLVVCVGSPLMLKWTMGNALASPRNELSLLPGSVDRWDDSECLGQNSGTTTQYTIPSRVTNEIQPIGISSMPYESSTISVIPETQWALSTQDLTETVEREEEPVLSPTLVNELERSTESDVLRVIITLKAQSHLQDASMIKEQFQLRAESLVQGLSYDSQAYIEIMDSENTKMRRELYENARTSNQPTQDKLVDLVVGLTGIVLHRYAFVNSIAAELTAQSIKVLENNPDIKQITLDEELSQCLAVSVPTTRAQFWYDLGYDGSGVEVAILDCGVDATHPALVSRVIESKSCVSETTDTDDYHGHGTHVAGIVASTDIFHLGVAPGASIINVKIAYDRNGDGKPTALGSDVMYGAEWAATNASDVAEIINLSYALSTYTGMLIDVFVSYYGIVWVGAADNSGPGDQTVTGVGYNMITVGNMDDHGTTVRTDDTINPTSSRGPTTIDSYNPDERIKPDLVAPGTDISSAWYDWEGILVGDYAEMTGTSMASPHVAGAIALLYDWVISSNTERYKALLMNSAVDYPTYGSGLDNTYGAGYMSLYWASLTRDYIFMGSLETGEDRWYKVYRNAGEFFKATAVWEIPCIDDPFSDGQVRASLSNLDLYLYAPDGSLIDDSISTVDNAEQVWMGSAPVSGEYMIRVHGTSVPGNVGTQVFALSTYQGTERAYTPFIANVAINDNPVADGANGGDYNRTQSFNIEVEIIDHDASPGDLTVMQEWYFPNGTHAATYPMSYNVISGMWETATTFGASALSGDWLFTITAHDEYDFQAEPYSFFITCLNEVPKVQDIMLSSTEVRRVNETLHVTVDALDFFDGTNLTLYLNVTKPNLSTDWYLMQQNPLNELFYLNLTLSETAPLGTWLYFIRADDHEGGVGVSSVESFNVLSHQYLLTVLSDHDDRGIVAYGSGWYDADTMAYAALNRYYTDIINRSREVFSFWNGDASGNDYSQSDPITMNGAKTVYTSWRIQYYLQIEQGYFMPVGGGWHDNGSVVFTSNIHDTFEVSSSEKMIFVSWSGDATGTNYSQSNPILMDGPKIVEIISITQYYITVISPHGSPSSSDWANASSNFDASVSNFIDIVTNESRWFCVGYRIDAGDLVSGHTCTLSAVDSPHNITFEWVQQYHLIVTSTVTEESSAPIIEPIGEWFNIGSYVNITAQNVTGFIFEHWTINGVEYDSDIISVVLLMNKKFVAIAEYSEIPPPFPTLTIVIALGTITAICVVIIIFARWKVRGR